MGLDDAINTDEMKKKLQNLREYMPGETRFFYDFGSYLATRLNSRLNPIGFNMAAVLTLYDLETGVNGFTGERVPASLSGMPSVVYGVMATRIPDIARAVCPGDFAKSVDEVCRQSSQA